VLEKLGDELLKYELTKQLDEYDDQFSTRLAYLVFVLRRFKYTSATIMTYGDMARLRDISNIKERSLRMNFSSDNSSTNSAIVSIKINFFLTLIIANHDFQNLIDLLNLPVNGMENSFSL